MKPAETSDNLNKDPIINLENNIEQNPKQHALPDLPGLPIQPARRVQVGLMRINADDQTKWKLCCYGIIIIKLIILISLIAFLALPKSTFIFLPSEQLKNTNLQGCQQDLFVLNNTLTCIANTSSVPLVAGQFVHNLVELNQFLIFYLNIASSSLIRSRSQLNQQIDFKLYHTKRQQVNGTIYIFVNQLISSFPVTLNGQMREQPEGAKFFISFVNKLAASDQFYWQIAFKNSSAVKSGDQFFLESVSATSSFSLFTIILRVVFFTISVVIFLIFNRIMLSLPKQKVSYQQRFVQLLSATTLTFNDQFYFITVIYPNPVTSFISTFFIWNFVFLLLMIWAFFLGRIRHEQDLPTQTNLITTKKVVVLTVFYLLMLSFNVYYAMNQTIDHPVFSSDDLHSKNISIFTFFSIVFFVLAIIYIVYLYINILRKKPQRLWRSNIFMVISLIFFIATSIFYLIGGYNIFDYSAPKIMFYISFMNIYSYFLQYLYTPTKQQQQKYKRGEGTRYATTNSQLLDIPDQDVDIQLTLIESQVQHSDHLTEHRSLSSQNSDDGKNKSARQRIRERRKNNRNNSKDHYQSNQKINQPEVLNEKEFV